MDMGHLFQILFLLRISDSLPVLSNCLYKLRSWHLCQVLMLRGQANIAPPVPVDTCGDSRHGERRGISFFLFMLGGQKRERSHTSRRLFVYSRPCHKGMSIFLCRRPCPVKCDSIFNWGQRKRKKDQSSLRPLRLSGEILAVRSSSV